MPTLLEYLTVFIEMLPLFVAMQLIPAFTAVLLMDYAAKRCYLTRAPNKPGGPKAHLISRLLAPHALPPASDLFITGVFLVLVAPFVEEIIFRGIPLLIDQSATLAWVATVGWALAHPIDSYRMVGQCKHARKIAILSAAFMAFSYLLGGIFHMLIWLRGFHFGAVAIAYHSLHNMIALLSEISIEMRRRKKLTEVTKERRRVDQPLPPVMPEPIARRVLRYVGLESSVVAASPEEAEKIAQALTMARGQRRVLRQA